MAVIGRQAARAASRPEFLLAVITVLALPVSLPVAEAGEADEALALVRAWVAGRYDNAAQSVRDLGDPAIPDDQKHRLMHQLFVPVPVAIPALEGYLVFQQSSVDGSEDPDLITRVGLLQFLVDADGQLRQRELNFIDLDRFKNAHRRPEQLAAVGPADVRFDPGCDFPLHLTPSREEITGVMPRGACRFFSPGLGKELIADDAVTIRPDEYWFLGRFVDGEGRVMWGNASPEPVKLIRVSREQAELR